jgi:hypothetical protein
MLLELTDAPTPENLRNIEFCFVRIYFFSQNGVAKSIEK